MRAHAHARTRVYVRTYARGRKPAPPLPSFDFPQNPLSDVWSTHSLRLLAKYFVRSCTDREDREANEAMTLAATMAGVGFGNAGVHLAHGCSCESSERDPRAE